eukprot:Nk52_evm3s277 gene=Nk52_evmTU3s277
MMKQPTTRLSKNRALIVILAIFINLVILQYVYSTKFSASPSGKEVEPERRVLWGKQNFKKAIFLTKLYEAGKFGDSRKLSRLIKERSGRKQHTGAKKRICVLQVENREDSESILASRTSFYRYSLRHSYTYTFSTCHGQRQRAFVISQMCGFNSKDTTSGDEQSCDYVYYADMDVLIRKGSMTIEQIIEYHTPQWATEDPKWISLVGIDRFDTIKSKVYISNINDGEVIVNCKHERTQRFLDAWAYGSTFERDQDTFGALKDLTTAYKDDIVTDLKHLGLYGQLTYHFAGTDKHLLAPAAKEANELFWPGSSLTSAYSTTAQNTDGSLVFSQCPKNVISERDRNQDLNMEYSDEYL